MWNELKKDCWKTEFIIDWGKKLNCSTLFVNYQVFHECVFSGQM